MTEWLFVGFDLLGARRDGRPHRVLAPLVPRKNYQEPGTKFALLPSVATRIVAKLRIMNAV
jgi:hypothetical protein